MRCCASKEDLIRSTPSRLGFFYLTTRYEALSQKGDPLERSPGRHFGLSWRTSFAAPSGTKAVGLPSMPLTCSKSWCCKRSITYPMTKRNIRSEIACRLCDSSASIWTVHSPGRSARSGCRPVGQLGMVWSGWHGNIICTPPYGKALVIPSENTS